MRYQVTQAAAADYEKLSDSEKALFKQALKDFNVAADRFVATRDVTRWPKELRDKSISGAPGVFEMTWSFAGPDGRATWESITVTGVSGESAQQYGGGGSEGMPSSPTADLPSSCPTALLPLKVPIQGGDK